MGSYNVCKYELVSRHLISLVGELPRYYVIFRPFSDTKFSQWSTSYFNGQLGYTGADYSASEAKVFHQAAWLREFTPPPPIHITIIGKIVIKHVGLPSAEEGKLKGQLPLMF